MDNIMTKSVASEPTVADLLGVRYTDAMKIAFPDVSAGLRPFGYLVLCQLRMPPTKSASGLIQLPSTKVDEEKFRTQAALVRAVGPAAFKRRDTLEAWPEGAWCGPGSFVRCPMYGGDRVEIKHPNGRAGDDILFAFFRDTDLIGEVIGDPLAIKTS